MLVWAAASACLVYGRLRGCTLSHCFTIYILYRSARLIRVIPIHQSDPINPGRSCTILQLRPQHVSEPGVTARLRDLVHIDPGRSVVILLIPCLI